MWHIDIDTTVIRLLNGTRAYLHAVAFAPVNSVAVCRSQSWLDALRDDPGRVGGCGL